MSYKKIVVFFYEKVLRWSAHPKAPRYLAFLSFIDAFIFPVSPSLMVLPMSFAAPKKSFYFAGVAIVSSFFGGILGYVLGYFCFEAFLNRFIEWAGYGPAYLDVVHWFHRWGFWAILLGCFTPVIPYKLFTISAGILRLNLGLFLLASAVGRTLRFLMIAVLVYWGGPRVEPFLKKTLSKFLESSGSRS